MKNVRNWYMLLDQQGLVAADSGPGQADGALTGDVAWCPYYYPPGTQLGYKGVTVGASQDRIISAAAAGFNNAEGSIEMLVRPSWNYTDGANHHFWFTYGGNNRQFSLRKALDGLTYYIADNYNLGSFTYQWQADTVYHLVLNWPSSQLYIDKVLAKTFSPKSLGIGSSTLYIGDHTSLASQAFAGNIYYFISRDLPLDAAEITTFYNFFKPLYIP